MFRIVALLVGVAIVAAAPVPLDAKAPKGCKRTNVRPANPQGSVLTQAATSSTASGAATADGGKPVMVFGSAQAGSDGGAAAGTVVPGITSEPGPGPAPARSRRKARKPGRTAAVAPASLPLLATIANSPSCQET